jgi:hypothetical protein
MGDINSRKLLGRETKNVMEQDRIGAQGRKQDRSGTE